MNKDDILNFKTRIKDFSIAELREEKSKIVAALSHMIFDEDVLAKVAIIDNLLEEKENG
jgi:hypothetical protein